MKLISWNVNGIRAAAGKGLLSLMQEESPDILCLQETKVHPDQLNDPKMILPSYSSYWSSASRPGYSGTAVFARNPPQNVKYGIGIRKFDSEGRFVITDQGNWVLYNIYFPNGSAREERHHFKQEFLVRLMRHLKWVQSQGREIIVVGDYNVAYRDEDVFDPVRLGSVSGFLPEEREWFKHFLTQGFTDVYTYIHPEEKHRYTWWSYRENARKYNRGWRIDHVCVTSGFLPKIQSIEIMDQQMGSDHCPIKVEWKEKEK